MNFRGASWKLLLGLAVPLFGVFAIGFGFHALELRRVNLAAADQRLLIAARLAPTDSVGDDWQSARAAWSRLDVRATMHPSAEPESAAVEFDDGRQLDPRAPVSLSSVSGAPARILMQRLAPAEPPRYLKLTVATPSGERSLYRAAAASALLASLAVIVLAIVQSRFLGRLTLELVRAARSIALGDLSPRDESDVPREFRSLVRALNQMRVRMQDQNQAVDRQRLTFEALLRQLHEGVVLVGPEGRIRLINPAAVRLLHLRPLPDPAKYLGLAVERVIPQLELQRLLQPTLTAPAPGSEPPSAEARLDIREGANAVHLLARAADIVLPGQRPEESGGVPGRMLVLTDISALVRTVQMQTDFVANASHELRTPVTTIRAAVETLLKLDLAEDSASASRFVGVIDRQSERLQALATDLLDLSRLDGRGAAHTQRRTEVADLLRDVETHFAARIADRRLLFRTDSTRCERKTIVVNPMLIRLALDNLVDNAIKFTPHGGQIELTCRSDGPSVAFEVADTGCGIPEEHQQRVFERFYQVERARSGHDRGTGLGLSIVRQAVDAMGGQIDLASRLETGTRVTIRIPQNAAA